MERERRPSGGKRPRRSERRQEPLPEAFWPRVFRRGLRNMILFAKAEAKLLGLTILVYSLGFWGIGIGHPILLGVLIGIFDLLPVVGASMVFIPWVLISFLTGQSDLAWQLFFLFAGVELLQALVEPYFLGSDLDLPFWLPLVILLACAALFNVFGILIAGILIPFLSAYRTTRREFDRHK